MRFAWWCWTAVATRLRLNRKTDEAFCGSKLRLEMRMVRLAWQSGLWASAVTRQPKTNTALFVQSNQQVTPQTLSRLILIGKVDLASRHFHQRRPLIAPWPISPLKNFFKNNRLRLELELNHNPSLAMIRASCMMIRPRAVAIALGPASGSKASVSRKKPDRSRCPS